MLAELWAGPLGAHSTCHTLSQHVPSLPPLSPCVLSLPPCLVPKAPALVHRTCPPQPHPPRPGPDPASSRKLLSSPTLSQGTSLPAPAPGSCRSRCRQWVRPPDSPLGQAGLRGPLPTLPRALKTTSNELVLLGPSKEQTLHGDSPLPPAHPDSARPGYGLHTWHEHREGQWGGGSSKTLAPGTLALGASIQFGEKDPKTSALPPTPKPCTRLFQWRDGCANSSPPLLVSFQ